MSDTPKIRKLSQESFIAFAVLAALALMTDVSALVLVTTRLRATEAAYAVYGVAVALTLAAGVILLIRRKDIATTAKDAVLAARFVASLRRFSVFERAFSDYGWRTLLSALVVLAGNIVYVSYLIWMAVAYISPWYAALAGFYAWLVIMRAGVVLAERLAAKRAGTPEAPLRDRHIIAVINGAMLIVAGGVIAAPAVQMAIGLYPHGGGIRDIVINAVFAAVKCTSAIVQFVRAAGYKDAVTQELRNISLVTALMSLLILQISVIDATAHGYSMWEYVVGLAVIVASSSVALGVVSVARSGLSLTKLRRAHTGQDAGTEPLPEDAPAATVTSYEIDKAQDAAETALCEEPDERESAAEAIGTDGAEMRENKDDTAENAR